MYLNNVSVTWKLSLVITGLLLGVLPVQAATTYNFTSGPIYVGELQDTGQNKVQTDPGLLQYPSPLGSPGVYIGSPLSASLSFGSPLAPNSVTPLHAESGGLSLLAPAKGGVQGYSADAGYIVPITSDIKQYLAGTAGNISTYNHYSTVDGQITTDASGSISAWNLSFVLQGGNDVLGLDNSTSPPTLLNGFPTFHQQAVLNISSNPASPMIFSNVVALNGLPHTDDFPFNGADTAFVDQGGVQFRYYSQVTGTVPEPETWAMMLAGLGLLGWQRRRLKSSLA